MLAKLSSLIDSIQTPVSQSDALIIPLPGITIITS